MGVNGFGTKLQYTHTQNVNTFCVEMPPGILNQSLTLQKIDISVIRVHNYTVRQSVDGPNEGVRTEAKEE